MLCFEPRNVSFLCFKKKKKGQLKEKKNRLGPWDGAPVLAPKELHADTAFPRAKE